MKFLFERFSEPSSWAGLGTGLAVVGVNAPTATVQAGAHVLAGICGLLSFFLKEKKRP